MLHYYRSLLYYDCLVDLVRRLSNTVSPLSEVTPTLSETQVPALSASRTTRAQKRPHRLSQTERSELLARYKAGEPVSVLAADYSIHQQTLYSHVRRAEIPLRSSRSGWSEAELQQAVALYQGGASLAAVGETFGVGSTTVWQRFTAADIELRPRRGWNKA